MLRRLIFWPISSRRPLGAWTSHLLHHISRGHEPVLIGHSSAGPLVADLASELHCRCIVIVDGHVPPPQGLVPTVRPFFRDFIERLAAGEKILPIWSRWFSGDAQREALLGLDRLAGDPVAFAKFENELLRFPVDWFDDTRSSLPIGIKFPPGSFRPAHSTITRRRKRNGGDGRSRNCKALICIRCWNLLRLQKP
jgi:Alpha/beta hydrolase family